MDSDMNIIWSAKAKNTFLNVLDYLNANWTKKEIIQFNHRTQITINPRWRGFVIRALSIVALPTLTRFQTS
jgi:hypothetical protein